MADSSEILEALRPVRDPELGISIVDLGLVYRAEQMPDAIEVEFTLTYPGCPIGDQIRDAIAERLFSSFPAATVRVAIVWDPPWGPEMMSEESRLEFGYPI